MKTLTIVVEKTGTGFSAYAKELTGVATVGNTIAELKENIAEVLEHQIDYKNETEGTSVKAEDFILNYVIDLEQFFDYFSVLNKSVFAEKYAHVNPSLFRQYTKGLAPLSSNKLSQISTGLHKLSSEIEDLAFV